MPQEMSGWLAAHEVWGEARRILAVRMDNIGDVIMLGPALRALRAAMPRASLTLLTSPAGSQAAPLLSPWIDEVMVERALWQDASNALAFEPAREHVLLDRLRGGRYDAAFIFTSFSQSPYPAAYACYLAGIPIRVGESKEFGGGVLSVAATPLPDEVHQVDRNLHLLEAAGIPVGHRDLEVCIPAAAELRAEELLHEAGIRTDSPFVVVAPGASCAARRYDPERYVEVTRLLSRDAGMPVVLVGDARDEVTCAAIEAGDPEHVVSLAGRTSIPELAALLARGRVLIGNDSGPMHLADAVRTPMVILFSGTDLESQWAPRNAPATLLRRPTDCAPCYGFTCRFQMECLDIQPEAVAAAATAMLAESALAATAAAG